MTDKNKRIVSVILVIIGLILLMFAVTRVLNKGEWDAKSLVPFLAAFILVWSGRVIAPKAQSQLSK